MGFTKYVPKIGKLLHAALNGLFMLFGSNESLQTRRERFFRMAVVVSFGFVLGASAMAFQIWSALDTGNLWQDQAGKTIDASRMSSALRMFVGIAILSAIAFGLLVRKWWRVRNET